MYYTNHCCCYSVSQLCPTLCDPMDCSTLGFSVLHYLLEFTQTHVHWISHAIQPSHPLLSPSSPPSIIPSIRIFSNELALHIRCQSFGTSASVFPMNIQGLFPLGLTDWISLLSKGLSRVLLSKAFLRVFQHRSLKASFLWCSDFFMVQLSHCTWLL